MSDLIELDSADGQAPDYMRLASQAMTNSTALQRVAIKHVEDLLSGKVKLSDATNPFVALMGVNAENVAAMTIARVGELRLRYPNLATDMKQLYPHMSDSDYIGRFAVPAKHKVNFFVNAKELSSRAIPQTDGSKVLVIPRYSTTTIDDTTFTLMYPVVLREKAYGGWAANYDLSSYNELHPITSSSLYPVVTPTAAGDDALRVQLEMLQVLTTTTTFDVNPASGVNRTIKLQDQYCHARVWFAGRNTSTWTEMHVTHDEMTYDATKPTAVLAVKDGTLQVRVPMIYLSTGLVTGRVRIDVYTTKGEILINATGMSLNDFVSEFRGDTFSQVTNRESALLAVPNKYFYFSDIANGGRNEVSFQVMRERVIKNTLGPIQIPITPSQLEQALTEDGFTIRRFVDNITTRDLLASKPLPPSTDPLLITPGSATMENVLISMGELKNYTSVADNGERVTIAPSAFWKVQNGVVVPVSSDELLALFAMEPDARVLAINQSNYVSSPFYYVIDTTMSALRVRPYYMDSPSALVTKFLGDNDTTGMSIEINEAQLTNTGNGWVLVVSTRSNQEWKDQDEVYKIAQLSFTPAAVGAPAAINGEYLGVGDDGEDIFSFNMPSGYDVDDNNLVSMLGFHALTPEEREVYCALEQPMSLTFCTGAALPSSSKVTSLDSQLVRLNLPGRVRAVQGQEVTCTFGVYLKNLWAACRTLAAATPWKTYPADIPAVWPENTFEINPLNGTEVFFNADGTPYTKLLHAKGDVMVIDGNIIYEHKKGEVILNGGEPVPTDSSNLQRQFAMLFLEGCYSFATDASTTQYTTEMARVLVDYITTGLEGFQERTSERTRVFFYPKITLGGVMAVVDGGTTAQIRADQQLQVRLGVSPRVNDNDKLRTELERKTIEVIYNYFANEVISISDLTDKLRAVYGSDVLSVTVTGLGGELNANVITLVNPSERLSIKKKVVILENGEFTVREDVPIDFFVHGS